MQDISPRPFIREFLFEICKSKIIWLFCILYMNLYVRLTLNTSIKLFTKQKSFRKSHFPCTLISSKNPGVCKRTPGELLQSPYLCQLRFISFYGYSVKTKEKGGTAGLQNVVMWPRRSIRLKYSWNQALRQQHFIYY